MYIILAILSILVASRVTGIRQDEHTINLIKSQDKRGVIDRICMAGLFMLLFLPAVARIDTGNDYPTYIERFHDIYRGNYVVTEKGFNLVVKGIYWLFDCENYLAVFAVFAFMTILIFLIGIYSQSQDFKLSFYLYMCLGLYFQCYNTVRYYFALSIVFLSMKYVIKKDFLRFLVLILIASLFHKSSLIVIPVFLLALVNWNRWMVIIGTVISAAGFIFKSQFMALFLRLYPSYVNEEDYIEAGGLSIVNIVKCLLVLALCLYYYKDAIKDNVANRFYFYLNYAALLAFSCFYFVPFVSRLGYYMNVSHILLLPALIKCIKNEKQKKVVTLLVYIGGAIYFGAFLYKAYDDYIKILPYSTWIFKDVIFPSLIG